MPRFLAPYNRYFWRYPIVRKYTKKISGIPHARKSKKFYLEVLRHRLAGKPVSQIAKKLNCGQSTVLRAVRRLEHAITQIGVANDALDLLQASTIKLEMVIYRGHMGLLRAFPTSYTDCSMQDYHACMSMCNLRLRPSAYVQRFVNRHDIIAPEYLVEVPQIANEDYAAVDEHLLRSKKCIYCPLGIKYRNMIIDTFVNVPFIYNDYNTNLTLFRLADPSEDQLLSFYGTSLIMTQIRTYLVAFIMYTQKVDIDEEEAFAMADETYREVTQTLFNAII